MPDQARPRSRLQEVAYPGALALACAGSWAALSLGAAPAAVPAVATALGAAWVIWLERAIPFRASWRRSHGDGGLDAALAALGLLVPLGHRALVDALLVTLAGAASGLALWPARAPLLLQGLLALLLADLGAWLAHRAAHAVPALWRLHAVHHSAPRLYWLNTWRFHTADLWLLHAASVTPLLLLGASDRAVALYASVAAVHGLFQHANLAVEHPRLGLVLSTTDQHRWHHDAHAPQAVNYGGVLSLWDRAASTFRRGGAPRDVGQSRMQEQEEVEP